MYRVRKVWSVMLSVLVHIVTNKLQMLKYTMTSYSHIAMHLKKIQICFETTIKADFCLLRNKTLGIHEKAVKSLISSAVN